METVTTSNLAVLYCLSLLPDGTPVTAVGRYDQKTGEVRSQLVHRTADGWQPYQDLPSALRRQSPLGISPDGTTCLLTHRPDLSALTLWTGRGNEWREEVIAHSVNSQPSEKLLRFDSAGHPVAILLHAWEDPRTAQPHNAIRVLRRNSP